MSDKISVTIVTPNPTDRRILEILSNRILDLDENAICYFVADNHLITELELPEPPDYSFLLKGAK